MASVAGALVSPIPVPRMSIWRAIVAYGVDAETVAVHKVPAAKNSRPLATITLLPTRTASLVPATEATATAVATGRRRIPVPSGLKALMNWKYWVTRKMNPWRAKNEMATDPLAAVKRGLR
jgi:hypothetical protein